MELADSVLGSIGNVVKWIFAPVSYTHLDVIISEDDISDTFNIATDYSAYAFEDNIKEGFLSVPGGHRIGFGGVIVK